MADLNKGYYVFNSDRSIPPKVVHRMHSDAICEAKRLAAMNPGQTFEVLAITCACRKDDVRVEFTEDGEDIQRNEQPF